VQIDGSEHAWFEERVLACTLLAYVDDATSRLIALLSPGPGRPSATSRRRVRIWSATASRSRFRRTEASEPCRPLTCIALAAYERYVDAVSGGDPDMLGFPFDDAYLFPWVPN
jgi:hypothetical protein